MNDIPGLNFLPERWRGWAMAVILLSPYVTRAYHAVANGGGFKSILSAIWFGTNAPRPADKATPTDPTKP